jgi:hypothetical protein
MARLPLLHKIRRGDWVENVVTVSQILVAFVALLGIIGWLMLNPFLLLSFIFAQPLMVLGLVLFIFAAVFFERSMVSEEFDPGQVIYRQGSKARVIHLVKSGTVDAVVRRGDGKEQMIMSFGAGHYIGVAALVPGITHKFTARARTEVEIVRILPGDFIKMFSQIPELRSRISDLLNEIDNTIEIFAPELKGAPVIEDLKRKYELTVPTKNSGEVRNL